MDHTVYGGPGVLLITGSDQTRYLNQSRVNPAGLKHIYNRIRTHPAGQKTIFMRGDIGKVRYTEIRCIYGHTRRIYSIWKSHIRFGPTLKILDRAAPHPGPQSTQTGVSKARLIVHCQK